MKSAPGFVLFGCCALPRRGGARRGVLIYALDHHDRHRVTPVVLGRVEAPAAVDARVDVNIALGWRGVVVQVVAAGRGRG